MSDYDGVPSFVAGQVLSAAAHLNALSTSLQTLYEQQVSSYGGFAGGALRGEGSEGRWHGFMRHKSDTFYYHVYFDGTGGGADNVTITVAESALATHTFPADVPAHWEGTASLAGLGLLEDQFYEVTVTGTAAKTILYFVGETDDNEAWPTFGTTGFVTGSTPTATDWNSLSTFIEALARAIIFPRALVTPQWFGGDREGLFAGEWVHHARYLAYRTSQCEGCTITVRMAVKIDGAWNWGSIASITLKEATATIENGGALDLESVTISGHTLEKGESYLLSFDGLGSSCRVRYAFEVASDSETLAGWQVPGAWAGLYFVNGDTGAPRVQDLVTDAVLLRSAARRTSFPMRVREAVGDELDEPTSESDENNRSAWMVRKHKFLHCLSNSLDAHPTLLFYGGERYPRDVNKSESTDGLPHALGDPKESEVALENRTDPFGTLKFWSLDLDTVAGLWPGTLYRIRDIECALEDTEG